MYGLVLKNNFTSIREKRPQTKLVTLSPAARTKLRIENTLYNLLK